VSGDFTVVAGRRVLSERSKILTISDGQTLPVFSELPLGALEADGAASALLPLNRLGLLHPAALVPGLDMLRLSTVTPPLSATVARGATSNKDGIANTPGQGRVGVPGNRDSQGRSGRRHHRPR
jgi:hypothetical protein